MNEFKELGKMYIMEDEYGFSYLRQNSHEWFILSDDNWMRLYDYNNHNNSSLEEVFQNWLDRSNRGS